MLVEHPGSELDSQGGDPYLPLNGVTLGKLLSWSCSFLVYRTGTTMTPTS